VNIEGLPESLAKYTEKVMEITEAFKATGELIA